MKVSAFDFELPDSSIALRPAVPRDSARLLQISPVSGLSDHTVSDLPELLRAGDVLVLNHTKVLPAALKGLRPARAHGGGGAVKIDINLHKQISPDGWLAFVRPAKRLRGGDVVQFEHGLTAIVEADPTGGECRLNFNRSDEKLSSLIEANGAPPLPPYIARQRAPDARDVEDYQTVYAKKTGSVAAPTAGLHFTDELMSGLTQVGIEFETLTLHVGAGTFLPVKSDDTDDHVMHSEWYEISEETADTLNQAKRKGRRIIAVGTTSLRALESAARQGTISAGAAETDIFITPGYGFKFVDGLMTNFHLPKSTLFMLVCALAGTDMMQSAYAHAIKSDYRFYSYGDSSLIWPARPREA